jgi:hypothetical protein
LPEGEREDPEGAGEPVRALPATVVLQPWLVLSAACWSGSALDPESGAPRSDRRAEPPIMRRAVTRRVPRKARARGGRVRPEMSAKTSWPAFSDQFQSR